MKQSTPAVGQGERGTVAGNADKWALYRDSFLKLIAEEARLQIVAGISPFDKPVRDENTLENAVVRVEYARLVYNDCRNILASALLPRAETFEPQPGLDAQTRSISRVANLLSEFRDNGVAATPADKRAAKKIVAAAQARFMERPRA